MAKPEQCAHCQKPATIHLTQIIDGKIIKVDLCDECPYKKGVTDPEGFSLAEMLLKPGIGTPIDDRDVACEQCGFTPADFKKYGRFGCPSCYTTFRKLLNPMLSNMHRDVTHRGKVPSRAIERVSLKERLAALEKSLRDAVEAERYEEAAEFRDQIRLLHASMETSKSVEEDS